MTNHAELIAEAEKRAEEKTRIAPMIPGILGRNAALRDAAQLRSLAAALRACAMEASSNGGQERKI